MKAPDWEKIKLTYVTSTLSYNDLAKKYAKTGVNVHEMKRHGADEGWVQARREYREKLFQKSAEKVMEQQSEAFAKLMSAATRTATVIEEISGHSAYFFPETTDFGGNTRTNFSGRDLRDYTTALRELTNTIRDLYNVPNYVQQKKMELEQEKWEMEKKKMQRELDDDNTKRIEIVVAPELEDYIG